MARLFKHVALISESERIGTGDLMTVAAALQKQALRDLAPLWDIGATVAAFARLEDVPLDYWPIIIRDHIGYAAAGIHLDRNGQPFSLVASAEQRDTWSVTCSHEMCEMLVDPFGNRLVAGTSIKPGQGRANYLVEVCDPSEDASFAYSVNGVLVSDFYTPHFFDPLTAPGVRYSYTGAITAPRTIRKGGYISWVDLATNIWWQQTRFTEEPPVFRELGLLSSSGSLRSQIDRLTAQFTAEAIGADRGAELMAARAADAADNSAQARSDALHEQIEALVASA